MVLQLFLSLCVNFLKASILKGQTSLNHTKEYHFLVNREMADKRQPSYPCVLGIFTVSVLPSTFVVINMARRVYEIIS